MMKSVVWTWFCFPPTWMPLVSFPFALDRISSTMSSSRGELAHWLLISGVNCTALNTGHGLCAGFVLYCVSYSTTFSSLGVCIMKKQETKVFLHPLVQLHALTSHNHCGTLHCLVLVCWRHSCRISCVETLAYGAQCFLVLLVSYCCYLWRSLTLYLERTLTCSFVFLRRICVTDWLGLGASSRECWRRTNAGPWASCPSRVLWQASCLSGKN